MGVLELRKRIRSPLVDLIRSGGIYLGGGQREREGGEQGGR